MNPPEPLELPAIVLLASSPPAVIVGTPEVVVLTSAMMFGLVPEQVLQKMYTSRRASFPVIVGVNVWPARLVELKPKPFAFASSTRRFKIGEFVRVTFPGLELKSQFAGTPVWKSACVVSVKQPLTDAADSEKFFTVVPPLVTTTFDVVPGIKPG